MCELAYTTPDGNAQSFLIRYSDEDTRQMWGRLARGAFSRGKVATWRENVRHGNTRIVSVAQATQALAHALTDCGPDIWAYNASFDKGALKRSGISVPDTAKWRDIWSYASSVTQTRKYCAWAALNGRMTQAGSPQTSVDALGSYLFGDTYSETHIALQDVKDELNVLQAIQRRHAVRPKHMGAGNVGARKVWACMRENIARHSVVLDMDGTCADLYHVPSWLDAIRNHDTHPYRNAQPMGTDVLKALQVGRACGARIHIVTWAPKDSNADYVERVGIAKMRWLHDHRIPYDEFHYLPYGTPKTQFGDVIVDDDVNNRKAFKCSGKVAISPNVSAGYVLDVLSR